MRLFGATDAFRERREFAFLPSTLGAVLTEKVRAVREQRRSQGPAVMDEWLAKTH